MSSTHTDIHHAVTRLRRRWRAVAFLRHGCWSLFAGTLASAGVLLVWPELPLVFVAISVVAAAFFAAAALTLLSPAPAVRLAKDYDDGLAWKDRLSSSVELSASARPNRSEMERAFLGEAAGFARTVDPSRVYPYKVPRAGYWLPLPLVLVAAVVLLPKWLHSEPPVSPEVQATVAAQMSRLEDLISREREKQPTKQRQEMLARLEELKRELSRDKLLKKDALSELSKLEQDLEQERKQVEERKKLDLNELMKKLQANEETRKLAAEAETGQYAEVANRIKEMIDELKEKIRKAKEEALDPEKLKELEEQLRELEEIQAKLLNLLNVNLDLDVFADVLEFLGECEGELGGLPDEEIEDVYFVRLGQCNSECASDKLLRLHMRLLQESDTAGKATMAQFLDDEGKRTDVNTEEHKVRVRETKGRSSFTQTQVANDGSRSQLGVKEVLQAEKRAAEDTIQRQDIPAGYREYLRKYFDGIQPDEPSKDEDR